jgi:NTP pyrophosphatase (non-canonical NTP hydrolase)
MHFDEYQELTKITAQYPKDGLNHIYYTSLGLASEAGEVAGKIKRILRDDEQQITYERRSQIADEIGDVLWYCARLADELDLKFSFVAHRNIAKLLDRQNRDAITGEGDTR